MVRGWWRQAMRLRFLERMSDVLTRRGITLRSAQTSRRFVPSVELLEDRITPTAFTMTSPTSKGELPSDVTAVGGIVLDLVGVNGRRVVSQLPASSLFKGDFNSGVPVAFRGNPGTIGIQSGFTAA